MPSHDRVKLAILDDYAHVAAAKFSSLSDHVEIVEFPDTLNVQTAEDQRAQIERLQPFTVISTMRERTKFPREVLTQLPNLKLLLTTGMRNASIDLSTCEERGIIVAGTLNNPPLQAPSGYNSTSEHTWALILGLARSIARDDKVVKEGGWQSGMAFGLAGKTLGVLGLGRLGAQSAKTGVVGFGMNVLAWSTSLTQEKTDEQAEKQGVPPGIFKVASSKRELFEKADVLSVQYVLSERSRGIVGEPELSAMKKNSLLVNTSRGPLVDEKALLKTLNQGGIRGAALDVFDVEPLPLDSEWRTTKWGQEGRSEVLLSPHMGYVEDATMHRWYEQTAQNLKNWLDGKEVERPFKSH